MMVTLTASNFGVVCMTRGKAGDTERVCWTSGRAWQKFEKKNQNAIKLFPVPLVRRNVFFQKTQMFRGELVVALQSRANPLFHPMDRCL